MNWRKISLFAATAFLIPVCGLAQNPEREKKQPAYGDAMDVSTSASQTALVGSTLFMTFSSPKAKGLFAFDVADPKTPRLIGRFVIDSGFPQSFAIEGTTLYLANGMNLYEIDISSPKNMKQIAVHRPVDNESNDPVKGYSGIAVREGKHYMAARRNGLVMEGFGRVPAGAKSFVRDLAMAGHFLYTAEEAKGIGIYEIGPDKIPRFLTRYPMKHGAPLRIRVKDDLLLVANGTSLAILSGAKSGKLKGIGALPNLAPFHCFGTSISDVIPVGQHTLLLASGETGIALVNMEHPEKPVLYAILSPFLYSYVRSAASDGTHLFVNDDFFGLRVIALSSLCDKALAKEKSPDAIPCEILAEVKLN